MWSGYALRYLVTPAEYERVVERLALKVGPSPHEFAATPAPGGPEVETYVRQHVRVFVRVFVASVAFNGILRLRQAQLRIPATRVAGSLSLLCAAYRLVYKLLGQRVDQENKPSDTVLARVVVPAIAAVAASAAFTIFPAGARNYFALYVFTKAVEYLYNYADDLRYLEWKPRILGSWLLFPLSMSQLFYTFVAEPAACPPAFSRFMLSLSGSYMPSRPDGYPASAAWPSEEQILGSVAEAARLRFPKFRSNLLYPNAQPLPASLEAVAPVVDLANPATTMLTGAILHPLEVSETKTFLDTLVANYTGTIKYLVPLYVLVGLVRNRGLSAPLLSSTLANSLRSSTFIAMTASAAWAGIALSQSLLSAHVPASTRFRLIGFASGLFAFVDQVNGRARYLYITRLAIMSAYNQVLLRRGGRPPVRNGDVLLFAGSLAAVFALFNLSPANISSSRVRKLCNWIQTGSSEDPAPVTKEVKAKEE